MIKDTKTAAKTFSIGENGNMAIKASAGSGKTFSLAMRFISLLFGYKDLDPAQIVAITFTRKAAMEIFDKIVKVLLLMERDEKSLEAYKNGGLLPEKLERKDVPSLLGRILKSRQLQISTIDSFSVKIIQAFAPELGISGTVEMVDENTDEGVKKTLSKVIRLRGNEIASLLKTYAEDVDPKRITETLKEFVSQNYSKFLMYPDERMWGNLPSVGTSLSDDEVKRLCGILKENCEEQDYIPQVEKLFTDLINVVETMDPSKFEAFPPIESDEFGPYIKKHKRNNGNKYPRISEEASESVRKLSLFIATVAVEKKNAKSRAAYRLLRLFDDVYSENVRSQGRLTFRDLPKLLLDMPEEKRIDLEYRLDVRNRHYMLDEFQDTSSQQWNFMEHLAYEAITGLEQTFFMVGDVKQSLYQWRNGNPKLFDSICKQYSIETKNSDCSYRSSPEVIGLVNEIFLHEERQDAGIRNAISNMHFNEHTTAKKDVEGYASVRFFSGQDEEACKAEEVVKLIKKISPLERSLSTAILVRTNDEVETYKQILRQAFPSMPVTTEGSVRTDESMACTFLSLLIRFAAHPSDAAASHVLPLFCLNDCEPYTPSQLSEILCLPTVSDWDGLSASLRKLIDEDGISGLVRNFVRGFEVFLPPFDRERLKIAVRLSRDFDGTPDEFLECLEQTSGPEFSADKTIQIMTIHKSKGLEFDVVILPELGLQRTSHSWGMDVEPMPADHCGKFYPSWVGFLPKKDCREQLPEIQKISEKLEADRLYEKCCGLYVALTRAKRALYGFVKSGEVRDCKTFRADYVLINALKGVGGPYADENLLYESGRSDWYKDAASDAGVREEKTETLPDVGKITVERPEKILRVSPSDVRTADFETEDESLAKEAVYSSVRFADAFFALLGTRVHRMFEDVEYLDDLDESLIRKSCGDDDVGLAAWKIWQYAVADKSQIRSALLRPERRHWLWREKEFLMKDDRSRYVSGCFDRVIVYLDDAGKPESAVIYDYKTDSLDGAGEFIARHGRQLDAYRRTLSSMLSLPEEKIECRILALRTGESILCPAS